MALISRVYASQGFIANCSRSLISHGNFCSTHASASSSSSEGTTPEQRSEAVRQAVESLKDVQLTPKQRSMIDRIIRVDHAGELGADRIYAGQLAILENSSVGNLIKHMWEQEKEHLATFERLVPRLRVRPTALLPVWTVAGWALGAGSALLGKEAAMACTVAVEESITDHYNEQIRELMEDDPEKHKALLQIIKKFRDDEMEHHDAGLENNAEQAPMYAALKSAIQFGCKRAIWLSERF